MKYGLMRRQFEQKYAVRIECVTDKNVDLYTTYAGVWIGKSWTDEETLLYSARESARTKADSVIACLNALEPRLERRWRSTHHDAEGQFYMFGVEPTEIDQQ